jgi:hypothetical protein
LHEYLVDSDAKGMVVNEIRKLHGGCKILSFGDSCKYYVRRRTLFHILLAHDTPRYSYTSYALIRSSKCKQPLTFRCFKLLTAAMLSSTTARIVP